MTAARQVIGATNPVEAAPGSIRGDFALEVTFNMVHGSDSDESAEREIGIWFPELGADAQPSADEVVLRRALRSGGRSSQRLGIEFEVVVPDVEELSGGDPADEVLENARRKAPRSGRAGALVIGCDTDVVDRRPGARQAGRRGEAREFLSCSPAARTRCSAAWRCSARSGGAQREGVAAAWSPSASSSRREIDRYLASGEWRERAGGYAIQGLGSTLVERVEGDSPT